MENSFPAAITRYAVYSGILPRIRPFPIVDDTVSGVFPGPEHESGDDLFPGLNDKTVGTADILKKKLPARVIFSPLLRIAGRGHKPAGLGEYFHQSWDVFLLCFADCDALLP